jgi:hypothetical protein
MHLSSGWQKYWLAQIVRMFKGIFKVAMFDRHTKNQELFWLPLMK